MNYINTVTNYITPNQRIEENEPDLIPVVDVGSVKQLMYFQNRLNELDVGLAKDQEQEIMDLTQSIADLRDMFQDMHSMISADDEMVDKIDTNVATSEANTDKGVMTLTRAANISHAVTIPVTLAVSGLLLGPVGMVVFGLKSALTIGGISVGGALAGGLFGKNVHTMMKSSKEEEFAEKEVKLSKSDEKQKLDLQMELKKVHLI